MKLHKYELAIVGVEESEDGYAVLQHGQRYSIKIANNNSSVCDVELLIDGGRAGLFRLEEESSAVIERPVNDDGFFTFYELGTKEARKAGIDNNESTGLITAIFKPEYESPPGALNAAPLPGGTGLSGHSNQKFTTVDSIHYASPEKFVTIHLRLGSSPQDTIRPLHKKMSSPVPPPLA